MMKKQGFIFILTLLFLFIINQIIMGFFSHSSSLYSTQMTDTSTLAPQKLFEKTWKEIDSGFYDSTLNSQDWNYWKKHYKGKIKTDEDAKVAIDTMIASLDDDYSRYLNKKEFEEQNTSIEAKISGIGVNIINDSGKIKIYSVLDNTPAKEAELQANDIILKVNNKNVSGMNISDVATLVRGEEGSKVTLELLRNNIKITKIVTRRAIKIKSVKASTENEIGYIQVSSFIGNSTSSEFLSALEKTKNTKGLIIDLRGNTGGLLTNAVFIANMVVKQGTIVNIVSRNGKVEDIKAKNNNFVIDKPLVVLVDGASASASEILSGALKDHHRAILVGTKTYGKGMVQRIIPLPNSTGLNLTIAKYLTPNGSDINKKGIVPDYIVKYTEQDFKAHKDPQKEKAEKILATMIIK